MIDQITGMVVRVAPHEAYLEWGGVTLKVHISLHTAQQLKAHERARLFTVLLLPREDGSPTLYGFAMEEERQYFHLLTRVPRVGPQLALAVLSHYTPLQLQEHLTSQNVEALTQVKGIGQKLAQQIILELQGKLTKPAPVSPAYEEAKQALQALGFSAKEASDKLQTLYPTHATASAEELVGLALKQNP